MTPEIVRAVLANLMTAAVVGCLVLVGFAKLDPLQATLVGTVLGAVLGNWKVPLTYFFDGVALAEQDAPPVPKDAPPTDKPAAETPPADAVEKTDKK